MKFKVCILAAGENKGVDYSDDFPITLLPIGFTSALSKIINKFPKEIEIVIAVGYKKQLIKDFLNIAHSNRKISIVEVSNWGGQGSGPGKSLLSCKEYLSCPFILISGDTIVSDNIPEPYKNWVGVSQVSDSTNYCMADVDNNFVIKFYNKVETPTLLKTCKNYKTILNNAFIGIAGIYDFEVFWEGLERNQEIIKEEFQVSNGLDELISRKIETIHFFNWFDIGKESGYVLANRFFENNNVIIKPDEFIYFENSKVIKYFKDKKIVSQRIERAKILGEVVPEIIDIYENFYSYNYIEGKTLAKINNVSLFREFLEFCRKTIWKEIEINDKKEKDEFYKLCREFYHKKTIDRLDKFYNKSNIKDKEEIINGELVPCTKDLIEQIDWAKLINGVAVSFHGDLQPENILVCREGFKLIDWRQSFCNNIKYGDIYYDFAKLHHALIITHQIIRNNQFEVNIKNGMVNYDFFIKSNLAEYKDIFEKFIQDNGYDIDKLKILSALTFLNIAPLHHAPYDKFLFFLGKYSLYKELKNNNSYKINNIIIENVN
jgi:UTP-glucose-1-phosphate uridylyltransferase